MLFFNDNRQIAEQVVRLAFEYARARAQALAAQPTTSANSANVSAYQTLTPSRQKPTSNTKTRKRKWTIPPAIDHCQRREAQETASHAGRNAKRGRIISGAPGHVAQHGPVRHRSYLRRVGSGTLIGQIEELARAVPSVNANTRETDSEKNVSASNNANSIAAAARERKQEPNGILDIIANLFTCVERSIRWKMT